MKKNEIIGILLIFVILIVFSLLNEPHTPPQQQTTTEQDTTTKNVVKKEIKKPLSVVDSAQDKTPEDSTHLKGFSYASQGEFFHHFTGKEDSVIVENDVFKVYFSTKGASIKQIELKQFLTWDKRPLKLYFNDENFFNVVFTTKKNILHTEKLYFLPRVSDRHVVINKDSFIVSFEASAVNENDSVIGKLIFDYIFKKNAYDFDLKIRTINGLTFLPPGTNLVTVEWNSNLAKNEKHLETERNNSTIHYASYDLENNYLSERGDDEKKITFQLAWIAYKSQFFTSALISKQKPFSSSELKVYTRDMNDPHYLKTMSSTSIYEFNPDKDNAIRLTWFSGPLKYKLLRSYHLKLERQIPLGWSFAPIAWINIYIVVPVFNWLERYNLNYGIIILILTILLKIVLFPITYRTYLSSAKMRVLQPDIEAINKKYPKPEDAVKKQQALMNLYKSSGINPASGCLPMLLQLPILIAMFRFFPSAIELRQKSFLWAHDLSSYDSILDLGFNIPFYGDHVSLFTLLMTLSTLAYTRINEKLMNTNASQTLPGMRLITYLLPILFLGFFNNYSAALSYYYLLVNLITFAQIFGFRYLIKEEKLKAQIEEYRKRPIKKSKWQQRLEEIQKQQQRRR